jgi:hypothetical protein
MNDIAIGVGATLCRAAVEVGFSQARCYDYVALSTIGWLALAVLGIAAFTGWSLRLR